MSKIFKVFKAGYLLSALLSLILLLLNLKIDHLSYITDTYKDN